MGTTNLNSAGCGCNSSTPVQPDNLAVVPAGSVVVQSPCAEGCAPNSSNNLSANQSASQAASDCTRFASPCLEQKMVTPAVNKTGSLVAPCASTWAMPGLHLYFPNLGYLEVLGANGNVVTYRNLTIEQATEIPAGFCFFFGAPPLLIATDENGEPTTLDSSSTLDAIYGVEGNAAVQIVPVNGTMLFACGGKWQRRQAGLMAYPIVRSKIVNYSSKTFTNNEEFTVSLPSKPTESLLSCSLGFQVELVARLGVWKPGTGNSSIDVYCEDQYLVGGTTDNGDDVDASYNPIDIAKTDTNITFKTVRRNGSGAVTYNLEVWAIGYRY